MKFFKKEQDEHPLPPCPICGKSPKIHIEGSCGMGGSVTIWCKKHKQFRTSSAKATIERAMSSARSQWYKRVRDYPNKKEQWG